MSASFANRLCYLLSLAAGLLSTGCAPGLSFNWIKYERDTKWAPDISVGNVGEHGPAACHGSVEVHRHHGVFFLIGPDGPWWQYESFYGIYFKEGIDAPEAFYLMVSQLKISPDEIPAPILGARGKVVVEGRHVLIDVEYKDSDGHWKKLPINGRHKIDRVYPDDFPPPKAKAQTK
jgi:hypothetical protein